MEHSGTADLLPKKKKPELPGPSSGVSEPRPPTSRHNSNSNNLYQCAACSCKYARPEHLARHVRTHVNNQQYVCDICGKAFARVDVCKRHKDGHARDAAASESRDAMGSKAKRQKTNPRAARVSRACSACAVARVKCEERKPCTRCCDKGLVCNKSGPRDAAWRSSDGSHNANSRLDTQDGRRNPTARTDPRAFPASGSRSGGRLDARGYREASLSHERSDFALNSTAAQRITQEEFNKQPVTDANVDFQFSDFMRDVMTLQPGEPQVLEESNPMQMLELCCDEFGTGDMDLNLASLFNPIDLSVFEPTQPALSTEPTESNPQTDVSSIHRRMTEIWNDS